MKRRALIQGVAAGLAATALGRATAAAPVVGITLPMTGVQQEVATELASGYRMALADAGIGVRVLDDASSVDRVAANVRTLAKDSQVIALSGIVGTPHAQAGLPEARREGLPVVGIRSGAKLLRTGESGVYHLRASYESELDKMIAYCRSAGMRSMAIMYSDDSFGKTSKDHLVEGLRNAGIEVAAQVSVDRNGADVAAAAAKVAAANKPGSTFAVALLLIVKPMMAAAHELRATHKLIAPIFGMSFAITSQVATSTDASLSGLGLMSAFPLPRVGSSGASRRYRAALQKIDQRTNLLQSVTAFEGYFYGSVIAQAVGAGGWSRDTLARRLDAGIDLWGEQIAFDANKVGYHFLQFMHKSRDGLLRV